MTLAEQIAQIVANAERSAELVETSSTVEENAVDFIAWCNSMGIVSESDDSERAERG